MTKPHQAPPADFSPGALVHARYRIVDVVGRGGLATVYRADDEALGRTVALKVIAGSLGDASDSKRHDEEVRLIAGFDHPGLVTLFDFVSLDDGAVAMLVMQFVDGVTLSSRIADGALSSEHTAEIGADVAAALAHIHSRGVMHRDVKPANILLPAPGSGSGTQQALLADFGIARLVDDSGITSTGMIVGTASYLSPEQARGSALGPATDIYSLGLVLLESLTAIRAFPGSAIESVAARLSADPEIPASVEPQWRELLGAMLARESADRPAASEVAQRLREIGDGRGDAPTLLLPASGDATTELLNPALAVGAGAAGIAGAAAASSAAATELLMPAAPVAAAVVAAPRRPAPVRTILIVAAVIGGLVIAGILIALLLNQLRSINLTPATPNSSQTATVEPTVAPIVYPNVDGDLGERLAELQQSVASLGSEQAQRDLEPLVLSVSELSAAGDFEGALSALERLQAAVDDAELSTNERDSIADAIESVRSELENLLDDKPGNGNKPPKNDD